MIIGLNLFENQKNLDSTAFPNGITEEQINNHLTDKPLILDVGKRGHAIGACVKEKNSRTYIGLINRGSGYDVMGGSGIHFYEIKNDVNRFQLLKDMVSLIGKDYDNKLVQFVGDRLDSVSKKGFPLHDLFLKETCTKREYLPLQEQSVGNCGFVNLKGVIEGLECIESLDSKHKLSNNEKKFAKLKYELREINHQLTSITDPSNHETLRISPN